MDHTRIEIFAERRWSCSAGGAEIARPDNAAPDQTAVLEQVESNMLNDKRIKSCLSRFNSGAYSCQQFLRAVSHSVGAHTESLQPRVDKAAAAAVRKKTRTGRRPCRERQLQGRRNRQRQPRQEPRTTVGKCSSWRHVLASHWCLADMRGTAKRVLCVCELWMGNVLFVVPILSW